MISVPNHQSGADRNSLSSCSNRSVILDPYYTELLIGDCKPFCFQPQLLGHGGRMARTE